MLDEIFLLEAIEDDEVDSLDDVDADIDDDTDIVEKAKKQDDLSKEERSQIFIDIMSRYNQGKQIAKPAVITIKSILKLDESAKLPNIIWKKEIVDEIDQVEYKEAVSEYNRGMQITLDAKAELLEKLDHWIYYVINKHFPTFKLHTKDLYQEGVIGILKGIDNYDAKRSMPTTYFFFYVRHEMTEYINSNINKTTSHYSTSIVKVKKAINHFAREGREWTITDIAQETGLSTETIMQAVKIMEYSKEKHYDSVDYLDSEISQNVASPEIEILKNEANEILYNAVRSLPEDEASIIVLKYGESLSYKNIAEKLNIPIDKVKKKKNSAIRKLRKNKTIHGNFNLNKEDKAINSKELGVIPISVGENIMEQLLAEEI